jgi:hypothetical protein
MKSITKRRLKTRSIGRNTLHKRRHSNRRWGAGQNGSREKRMIGGAVDKNKGGVDLSNMFNRRGWKCVCKTIPQDSSKSAPDTAHDTVHVEPPSGQSNRPPARNSIAAVTAPNSSSSSGFRRSVAQSEIQDATLKGKYLINDDFDSVKIDKTHTIIIRTKRGADDLPEHINNKNFITKVNNIDIKVNTLAEFYKLLNDNNFYDNPVVLTVARGAAGGTGPEQFMVRVILKRDIPMQGSVGGGGKKTTYQRKKHVTQRKINTKRMKVMVGGTTIKEVTCTCTKEDKKAPRRNKISPTPPSAEESNV